jgi:hypothetical protein
MRFVSCCGVAAALSIASFAHADRPGADDAARPSAFAPGVAESLVGDPWTVALSTAKQRSGQFLHGRFRTMSFRSPAVVENGSFRVADSTTAGDVSWPVWATGLDPLSTFLVGDFDGNSYEDLLEITTGGVFRMYRSIGTGFLPVFDSNLGVVPTYRIFAGDFNGDGFGDVAYIDQTALQYRVALSALPTALGFLPFQTWAAGFGGTQLNLAGDFTGDGRTDILIAFPGSPTSYAVAVAQPNNTFQYQTWLSGTTAVAVPDTRGHVGDFDGDGFQDVLLMNSTTFTWSILRSTGTAFTAHTAMGGVGSVPDERVRVADFNGDGRDDVAFADGWVLGQALSLGTSLSLSTSTVLSTATRLLSGIARNNAAAIPIDDAEDVVLYTDTDPFLAYSNNVAPERTIVSRKSVTRVGNFQRMDTPWLPFRNPSTSPLYLTEVNQTVVPNGFDDRMAIDTCVFRWADPAPTPIREVTCGFQYQNNAASPVPPVPGVPIPGGGIPVLPGDYLAGQTAIYFFPANPSPPSSFPGLYRYQLKLRKTPPGNVQMLRIPYLDEEYLLNVPQPNGNWGGLSNPQSHTNTSAGSWYVKRLAFFNSMGLSHNVSGSTNMKLYLLSPANAVLQTIELGTHSWTGNAYTAPAPITLTTPLQVLPGQKVMARAYTEVPSAGLKIDTGFYIFVDTTP